MDDKQLIHPNREQLESFLHGKLQEDERKRVEQHIAECDSCCDVLRSVPHDELVVRIQDADTSQGLGETELEMPRPAEVKAESIADQIPPELAEHPRYRIIKQLGAGGMGVVYQAQHRLMERPVALKVISARLVDSDVAVERFRLEVKAAARLSHRNIVAAYDAEQAGDLHFLVMELIQGVSLSELVQRRGKLPVLHACNYAMQAAQGLQHALEKGMVHRDIKPHNLMRTPKGTIKILDFGLARFARQQSAPADAGLTSDGATLGTPDYIAPEQARDSRHADIRADIYSLGCTLYYLLTGRPPFPDGTAMEKVVAHVERDPTPLSQQRDDIPDDVIHIVQRMMAKDPADRYQSPAEVVDALKPFGKPSDSDPSQAAESTVPASVREPISQPVSQPSTPNTHVDIGPTLLPLDQLDLPAVTRPAPVVSQHRKRRLPDWQKLLRQNRTALASGSIAVLLVIALIMFWPSLRGLIASLSSANNGSFLQAAAADGWIDLIPQIDTAQHAVTGQWRKRGGELVVSSAPGARLLLPYQPPREYDFEVSFTRDSGEDSIALHFVAGQGQASFDIDGWKQHLAGIQNIDGRTMELNPTRVANQQLINGQRYTALLLVRRDRVEAYLDGKLLTKYRGDGSNLSLLDLWELNDARAMGIGAYQSSATFHRIRVRHADAAAP